MSRNCHDKLKNHQSETGYKRKDSIVYEHYILRQTTRVIDYTFLPFDSEIICKVRT